MTGVGKDMEDELCIFYGGREVWCNGSMMICGCTLLKNCLNGNVCDWQVICVRVDKLTR